MLIASLQHNPETSKQKTTPLNPPLTGYLKQDLQKAWLHFIRKYDPYSWYVTLTFKDSIHKTTADKRFKRWITNINEALYGNRFRKRKLGVSWVRAMERQKRGTIHFHALIRSPEMYKLKRLDYMKLWETNCGRRVSRFTPDPNRFDRLLADPPKDISPAKEELDWLNDLCPEINEGEIDCMNPPEIINGFARIYKYDPSQGASAYCSKYITKGFDNLDIYIAPPLKNMLSESDQGKLAFLIG